MNNEVTKWKVTICNKEHYVQERNKQKDSHIYVCLSNNIQDINILTSPASDNDCSHTSIKYNNSSSCKTICKVGGDCNQFVLGMIEGKFRLRLVSRPTISVSGSEFV